MKLGIKLLLTTCMGFLLYANNAEEYKSGERRIKAILSGAEENVSNYKNKTSYYAQTQNLAQDLNIEEIARFFGCKTVMGEAFLTQALQRPFSPVDSSSTLTHRQNAIKALVANPTLKKEIEQLLEHAKQQEQEIIELFSDVFIGKTCPDLKNLALLKEQKSIMYPVVNFLTVNPTGKIVNTTLNLVSLAGGTITAGFAGRALYQLSQVGSIATGTVRQLGVAAAYGSFVTGLSSYQLYKDYSYAAEKRSKMHALNQFIDSAQRIENITKKLGIAAEFKMSSIKNPECIKLIENLKASRYQNKDSWFFWAPLVHGLLYKVYDNEKYLLELFSCVAEIDAYNALATKIIESEDKENVFCFATFLKSERASIKAKDFWNVLVKDAVPSTLSEQKNIILTGPNAGGKTTTIRALLQNILLGQTYGIAAAQEFAFTAFDVIHSYLNISDDLLKGLSLFKSEIKRAQDIVQEIKLLAPHKKFFFALDELFTGTIEQDGQQCAYEFVQRLALSPNIQFIYATHFDKLKELGTNNAWCANYKVDAPTKDAQGKLVYPFTLSQGANEARVALDMAREAHLFG
jgi:MutS domain V